MAKSIVKAVTKSDLKKIKSDIDKANLKLSGLTTEESEILVSLRSLRQKLRDQKKEIDELEELFNIKSKELADEA